MKVEFRERHINLRGENEKEREMLNAMYKHGIRVWGGGAYLSFSANIDEIKFPYGEIADEYAKEFIVPWFKRCIEDFPNMMGWQPIGARQENVEVWFKKWFSQFIEKGENDA